MPLRPTVLPSLTLGRTGGLVGALLDLKDELRGGGALNWSVERPMAQWDGVGVYGSPQRVTTLILAEG